MQHEATALSRSTALLTRLRAAEPVQAGWMARTLIEALQGVAAIVPEVDLTADRFEITALACDWTVRLPAEFRSLSLNSVTDTAASPAYRLRHEAVARLGQYRSGRPAPPECRPTSTRPPCHIPESSVDAVLAEHVFEHFCFAEEVIGLARNGPRASPREER